MPTPDLGDVYDNEVAMDSVNLPTSRPCSESRDDEAPQTKRRPKTAEPEMSSVKTSSVATQTSFMHEVNLPQCRAVVVHCVGGVDFL